MSGNGRFGGHFVLGHVDELGTVSKINETANAKIITIQCSQHINKQLIETRVYHCGWCKSNGI